MPSTEYYEWMAFTSGPLVNYRTIQTGWYGDGYKSTFRKNIRRCTALEENVMDVPIGVYMSYITALPLKSGEPHKDAHQRWHTGVPAKP